MKMLLTLQELQKIRPKTIANDNYVVYAVEDASGSYRLAIPVENTEEFDLEEKSSSDSIAVLVDKYNGFIVK